MSRPFGGVSHARIRGTRRTPRFRGGRLVLPYPSDRASSGFVSVWARSIFSAPPGPGGVLVSLVGCFPPRGRTCFRGCRPVCKPPERGARAPVCKAAQGGHRQVQGRARRRAPVRRGLWLWWWWAGACGVLLAAGARARRAACAGCVPRSREAARRAIAQSKRNASSIMMSSRKLHHRNACR